MINNTALTFRKGNVDHPFWEWVFIAFLAFSASSLATKVNLILLGRNLIEPYILVGFFGIAATDRRLRFAFLSVLHSCGFLCLVAIIFILAIVGVSTTDSMVNGIGGFLYVYSDFRSILILVFFFFLSKSDALPIVDFDRLSIKFFISICLFDLISIVLINNISMDATSFESSRQAVIALAPMFLVARFLISANVSVVIVSITITGFVAVVSLMRFNYIFLLLEFLLVLGFLCLYIRSISRISKAAIMIASIVGLLMVSIPYAISYFESNEIRMIHGLLRLEALIGLDNGTSFSDNSEAVRLSTTKIIFLEVHNLFIPKGIGAISHIGDVMTLFRKKYGVMSTVDSGLFYLVYHAGALLGFLAIFYIFKTCASIEIFLLSLPSKIMFLVASSFIIAFLSMLILKAWPFMYISVAFQYAMLIPYVIRAGEFNNYFCLRYKY